MPSISSSPQEEVGQSHLSRRTAQVPGQVRLHLDQRRLASLGVQVEEGQGLSGTPAAHPQEAACKSASRGGAVRPSAALLCRNTCVWAVLLQATPRHENRVEQVHHPVGPLAHHPYVSATDHHLELVSSSTYFETSTSKPVVPLEGLKTVLQLIKQP